ncbi:uncharacterized protein LOC111888295 [Lactuca sativa]|uniref:uncharacterized protein LOC111888295 n=1 Tax=Lactuca sativa TaxID=4236 RepID=UPI000CD88F7E|nr:uncharacterized protein LOC111888295 [Lactuca sativa]
MTKSCHSSTTHTRGIYGVITVSRLCLYQRHQLSIKNSQIKRSGEFGNRHLCPASSDHWLVSLMKILKKNDAGEVLIVCCSLALIGVALVLSPSRLIQFLKGNLRLWIRNDIGSIALTVMLMVLWCNMVNTRNQVVEDNTTEKTN